MSKPDPFGTRPGDRPLTRADLKNLEQAYARLAWELEGKYIAEARRTRIWRNAAVLLVLVSIFIAVSFGLILVAQSAPGY